VEARIVGPDGVLVIRINDPDRLGTGRVELTVNGRPAKGDCVAFPSGGAEQRVNARLRPATETDDAGPAQLTPAQRRGVEGL
jgi:cyclic beta-1,2-glucan synthetase